MPAVRAAGDGDGRGGAGAAAAAAVQLAVSFGAVVTGVCSGPSPAIMVQMPWTARFGSRQAVVAFTGLRSAALKRQDLLVLKELAEKSSLTAVIGARYPLERIAEAHARVDAGRKKGNIVVTMP